MKDIILDKASEFFLEKDYKAVKIKDICKACDTSVGNFYHHFKSKEAIFAYAYENSDSALEKDFSHQGFERNFDAILFIIERQVYHIEKYGLLAVMVGVRKQMTDSEHYTINKNRFLYKKIEELVLSGVASGEFKTTFDVSEIVEWLVRTIRGVIYDWCIYEGSYNLSKRVIKDVGFLLLGLLKIYDADK